MATVFSKRIIAYVLDFFVVSAVMWILSYFIFALMGARNIYQVYQYFPYAIPVLILVYFILCEKLFAASIGKSIMRLQVKSENGRDINWPQAIVRNLTKIYWFPIIFDWIIGRILRRDRILNSITKTKVIKDNF